MQILTANRLREGDVVYWGCDGWKTRIDDAMTVASADEARSLSAIGEREIEANRVVEAYLIDVARHDGITQARHYREAIRALGPSVRPDLGKQAQHAKRSEQV